MSSDKNEGFIISHTVGETKTLLSRRKFMAIAKRFFISLRWRTISLMSRFTARCSPALKRLKMFTSFHRLTRTFTTPSLATLIPSR